MEMILVKGGTFTMGATSEQGEDWLKSEKPLHQVTLSDFYIGKFLVTQKEWEEIMGDNPSYFKGDDLPVESVSWNDVQDFISKLNQKTDKTYRLPTEAEWEFAARGGSSSRGYKYAGSDNLDEVAWYNHNSGSKTHPIGLKKANELRLYDMSGNVREWCADWKGVYSPTAQTNPKGPSSGAADRVVRSGGWSSISHFCRVSARWGFSTPLRGNFIGFRLAMSV